MAKLTSLFTYNGTFKDVTNVHSKLYGKHIRAARGTYKTARINDALKKSGELIQVANRFAKAVKDAIDPYRKNIKDGSLWFRLVSLFRRQLGEKGMVDLRGLKGLEFHPRYKLSNFFFAKVEARLSENRNDLEVTATTICDYELAEDDKEGDSYQQTIIVIFFDPEMNAVVADESVILPLVYKESQTQKATFLIPDGSTIAVIALKIDFFKQGKSIDWETKRGMEIVEVVEVEA
ncbi:MAG: hypothetical protein JST46_13260 [Bacteroidetes bacterium]|nr:hypothetical protein [Bacteroidota bacterium]